METVEKKTDCKTDPVFIHREVLKKLARQMDKCSVEELAVKYEPSHENGKRIKIPDISIYLSMHIAAEAEKRNWSLCWRDAFMYLYNGSFWYALTPADMIYFIKEVGSAMGLPNKIALSTGFVNGMVTQLAVYLTKPTPEPSKKTLINFKTMTMEINPKGWDGELQILLRCKDPDDFLKYELSFDYDERAQCPVYDEWLNWAQPEKEVQTALHEFVGYCFTQNGTLKLEKALFNQGNGGNGKSTFKDVMTGIFGRENVLAHSLSSLCDTNGYFREQLANCIVNICGDIGTSALDNGIFKTIASGEPLSVRTLHKEPRTLHDYGKLWFNCQDLPKNPEDTLGYKRRFMLVRWKQTMPDNDPKKNVYLADEIIDTELPGVFNRILAAFLKMVVMERPEFTEMADEAKAWEIYMGQYDQTANFIKDMGWQPNSDRDRNGFLSTVEIFDKYKAWLIEEEHLSDRDKLTKRMLSAKLIKKGFVDGNPNNIRGFWVLPKKVSDELQF